MNNLLSQNKKILADEDDLEVADLDLDLGELEKVHSETVEKMKEYNVKIKNGLWSDDQELRKQLVCSLILTLIESALRRSWDYWEGPQKSWEEQGRLKKLGKTSQRPVCFNES